MFSFTSSSWLFSGTCGLSPYLAAAHKDRDAYTYVYVAVGTNCTAQTNAYHYYDGWFVSPLTNRNSSIPIESSGDVTVDRYGVFSVNFKPFPPEHPPPPPDYTFLFI